MSVKVFDYIIIGAGASGLQLALAMSRDAFFKDKKIAIIEKRLDFKNDKTWCFWEERKGFYDDILFKSWDKGYFKSLGKTVDFNLKSYQYKMLKSIDFYHYAISVLTHTKTASFVSDEISTIESIDHKAVAVGLKERYQAKHVFDSRLPNDFKPQNSINILQHFKGWFVETTEEVFTPERFCMMDYNHTKTPETAFFYILPFSRTNALVEYTYFTPNLVEDAVYEQHIEKYLKEVLKVSSYKINEVEKGIIPMTTYPFHLESTEHVTKIGTSGGWVKPSTGYSFKNAERFSLKIIENIKSGRTPSYKLFKSRFKHYDKMFLDVLFENNAYGKQLFYHMYSRNSIQNIFRFLDEKTSFSKELRIMAGMTSFNFIKAFFRHALSGFKIK